MRIGRGSGTVPRESAGAPPTRYGQRAVARPGSLASSVAKPTAFPQPIAARALTDNNIMTIQSAMLYECKNMR